MQKYFYVKKQFLSRSLIVFFILIFSTEISFGGPIDTLKPGEWYEAPISKFSSAGVFPDPVPPGIIGPTAIITAWGGGAYDTKRDRLIIWGGGHGDYGGNEIYTFDINTFKWSRIWGPSPDIPPVGGPCFETYSDGNPASRHTYDGLEYLPLIDKFFNTAGALYCGSGGGSSGTWLYDFATSSWQRMADAPGGQVTSMSAYDPVNNVIYVLIRSGTLYAYDPKTNTWTERGGGLGWTEYDPARTIVYHPTSKLVLVIGGGAEIIAFDMSKKFANFQPFPTTGGDVILDTQGPGAEYDPITNKIVAWSGLNGDVYTLDVNTRIWTRHPPAGSVIPKPPDAKGHYGRWRYIPSKNVFIGVNSAFNNVYFYRLTSDLVPPDTTAPSPPTGLAVK